MILPGSTRQIQRNDRTFGAVYYWLAKTGTLRAVNADRGKPRVACTPDLKEIIL